MLSNYPSAAQTCSINEGHMGYKKTRHQLHNITREAETWESDLRIRSEITRRRKRTFQDSTTRKAKGAERSSIPSQSALADKDDHSCTARVRSDTALSSRARQLHQEQTNFSSLASKQAVSIHNRLCQQGEERLYHREDSRALLVCAIHPRASSTATTTLQSKRIRSTNAVSL